MSKLALTLLVVPTLMMLGSPSKTLTHNSKSQLSTSTAAPELQLAALSDAAETSAPTYQVSLSARAHAANHRAVSSQVVAMVSAY